MSSSQSSAKNHSKKLKEGVRERDRIRATASESGGSSQCDTPPLNDRDGGSSQGKYAGIGPDSVQCMAEQVGVEMNQEALINLAEDVSYKLRQMISGIALHSELMKKSTVDSWDVNTAFMLADSNPAVGATSTYYAQLGEEKLYYPIEEELDLEAIALTPQMYVFKSHPTISVEWITDDKSLNNNTNISASLCNYYTKVARAILNLKKKPKEVAVADLMTNTRIGPIFPNLFNLAVLVLNDDNLNALNVRTKRPLQCNVLDMVDALCANPCSLDTNILQQFQRLFPVMVSNILGNGSLAEKMVAILTKITRTWPNFVTIGKGILYDYLCQGSPRERLTAPMIKCVLALGRQAIVECLGERLDYLDACIDAPRRYHHQIDIRETVIEASTFLLRSEPNTYLEDFVETDYTLYEMLGDSILPRRTLYPKRNNQHKNEMEEKTDDESTLTTLRTELRRPKIRLVSTQTHIRNGTHRETVFQPTKFTQNYHKCIRIRIKNCRTLQVPSRTQIASHTRSQVRVSRRGVAVIASGLLHRYKYKMNNVSEPMPLLGALSL